MVEEKYNLNEEIKKEIERVRTHCLEPQDEGKRIEVISSYYQMLTDLEILNAGGYTAGQRN